MNIAYSTEVLTANDPVAVTRAANIIRSGGIIGMPTETVYGLGANALDEKAVEKIFIAKGRPQDNPLIVHISDFLMLESLIIEISPIQRRLAESFWPGPLTIIFKKSDVVPNIVTAGLETVAIRMPSHPVSRAIISASGLPIAAPSANISGKPSPTTAEHVNEDMYGKIPLIIDGGCCEVGVESTVVSVTGCAIVVLRPGGITVEMIKSAVPEASVVVADAVLRPLKAGEKVLSPGMKHKHYSPKAKVLLCKGSMEKTVEFANGYKDKNAVFIAPYNCKGIELDRFVYDGSDTDEAKRIFHFLRKADENGYDYIIVRIAENDGVGLAFNNRVLRAAGFEIIEL